MKLQQLRFLCEVVDRGFNISRAAETLFTSQPGISRQIGMLEAELGVDLILRRGNKLVGLTAAGVQAVEFARSALTSVEAIGRIGREFNDPFQGSLTVATTHTHARYVLAQVIQDFAKRYPRVTVKIVQGSPNQIAEWIGSGSADIGIATRPTSNPVELALVHCYDVEHILIALPSHPLLRHGRITLAAMAKYPLIGYDDSYLISRRISEKFRAAGIEPNIVMRASDSDVIKSYVAAGLGVAIIPTLAFDRKVDRGLRARAIGDLFDHTVAYALIRKGLPLRAFTYDFLRLVSPRLTREAVDAQIYG